MGNYISLRTLATVQKVNVSQQHQLYAYARNYYSSPSHAIYRNHYPELL